MQYSFFRTVFVSLIALGVAGCAYFQKEKSDPVLEKALQPQPLFRFPDLPVPAGFKTLTEQSYSFESAGMRVGVLKYLGKAYPSQVVTFYKEQMPLYNWELLNIVEYGERILNFNREKETCIISILPKGSNTCLITINFGPKAQYPAKTAKPLK